MNARNNIRIQDLQTHADRVLGGVIPSLSLKVNGKAHVVDVDPETPLQLTRRS